ncbi:MAG: hypothetical protein PHI01_01230 [Candidatus Izemoplasmatales bacterium]|nr:hypothetical protein [Candidatus Izemoplasmatales bacterium]
MNKSKLERLSIILVFGSIWGIIEATLGYVLHLLPALIAGSVMFPIVVFILLRARRGDLKRAVLLFVGLVAAVIKGANLVMPAATIFKTINPMVSILFETLIVFLLIPLIENEKIGIKVASLPLAGIVWRGLYLLYMGGQFFLNGFLAAHLSSFDAAVEFLVVGGLIDGLIALIALALDRLLRGFTVKLRWQRLWLGIPAFVLAVVLTLIL